MSGHRPTRGRGLGSKGRSSGINRGQTSGTTHSEEGDDAIGQTNDSDEFLDNEDMNEELTPSENETPTNRRGSNHGTPLPSNPSRRKISRILTKESFDDPASTRDITATLKGYLHGEYQKWGDVPEELRRNMFDTFKTRFQWPEHTDGPVYNVWKKIAGKRLKGTLWEVHKLAKGKTGSSNPVDWKHLRPYWIGDLEWAEYLKIWSGDRWQRNSKINSANHKTTAKGPPPKHIGGSIPFSVHEKRMTDESGGRRPTPFELFQRTHIKPNGEFIDDRSKEVHDKYVEAFEEKYSGLDQEDSAPPFDIELWTQAIDDICKYRVYGLGSSQAAKEILHSSRPSRPFMNSNGEELDSLRKELEEEREGRKRVIEELEEKNRRTIQELEERMNASLEDRIRSLLRDLNLPNSIFESSSGTKDK